MSLLGQPELVLPLHDDKVGGYGPSRWTTGVYYLVLEMP